MQRLKLWGLVQVISCDTKGFIKYWDADTYAFPTVTVSFNSIFQTNLMDCVKEGCMAKSVCVSKCGGWFAVTCSDLSVRVFSWRAGKLRRRFETSMKACLSLLPECTTTSASKPANVFTGQAAKKLPSACRLLVVFLSWWI
jgi:hypothetical protein